MKPHAKRMLRGLLEAAAVLIVIGIGVACIASVLGCVAQPPGTMAGHNTTLPAQPACLLFCFAEVRSSIDTPTIPNGATTRDKKGKQTQPPVVVPPPVINSAPTTPTTPAAPLSISPLP